MELPTIGMAAVYEEMNRSIFGPVAINCAAPDDGNMFVLNRVATEKQKTSKNCGVIIDGDIHSFVMTEPHPGSGSDPSMMLTKAEPIGNSKWRITGRKWYITGAESATHFILMARTSDDARKGLTAFMFHKDQPGWRIVRRIPIMGPEEHGGHCEIEFDGLEIDDSDRLMEVGDGLSETNPSRHGAADALHALAQLGQAVDGNRPLCRKREGFGSKLIDRERSNCR